MKRVVDGRGRRTRRRGRRRSPVRAPGRARAGLAAALLLAALPTAVAAQEVELGQRCDVAAVAQETQRFCRLVAQAVEVAQPRLGLAFTGGNPVPGTASTLGMRIGALPRLSAAGRITGVWTDVPEIRARDGSGEIGVLLPSFNADAAVGLFQGFSPAPTVGGLGSIDVLASAGLLPLPDDDGFRDDVAFSWAAGVRLGILRESFTLPGVSVSGMYRRVEEVGFGDEGLDATDAFFELDPIGVWSLRAGVSKRLFLVGVTLGAGYDHYSSDVALGATDPLSTEPADDLRVTFEDFENDRLSFFGNVSWTVLLLNLVGEVGWQTGADAVPGAVFTDDGVDPDDGAFFGSLALRLSI